MHKEQKTPTMKNISAGLSIVALLVGTGITVYAYINNVTDSKIETHTAAMKELADEKYFSKSDGVILQTQLIEIEKKLDKIILTQEEIYKELKHR